MKKKIAYILVALLIAVAGIGLGVGAFNNLNNNEPNTEVQGDGNEDNLSDEDLMKKAVAYVKTIYKDVAKETAADYERIGTVPVGKAKFTVDWSVDVDENIIKIVKQENGMVTIDINEEIGDETPYVLTATISDGKGNKESLTWDHVIPAKITGSYQEIVDMAYALKNGESLPNVATLQGTVTTVNTPWDSGYKNITVTIVVEGREDKPIQCYRLKSGAADASQIEKGDLITVTGTLKNYNGTIEFDAGCVLDENLKGQGTIAKVEGSMLDIVKKAYALKDGEMLEGEATLAGSVISVDTEWNAQFKNITVTIVVDGSDKAHKIMCYRLKSGAADASKVEAGDHITVTGMIKNYKGTIEFDAGCTLDKLVKGGGTVAVDPVVKPEGLVPTAPEGGLKAGDKVVIYNPAYSVAFSANKTQKDGKDTYYNAAVKVTMTNGKLAGYKDSEVYTVVANKDGSFSFVDYKGRKVALAESYNSLNFDSVNDKWTVKDLGKGYFYIRNSVRTENRIEYSSKYDNWDTVQDTYAKDDACKLSFYVVSRATKPATLDDAIAALKAKYTEPMNEKGSYTLGATIAAGGTEFPVTWTVTTDDTTVVKIEDGKLVIKPSTEKDVTFTLKASVSDTKYVEWTYTVAKVDAPVVEPGTNEVAPTKGIFSMYQGNLKKTLYLTGEMDGFYFATTENIEEAVEVGTETAEGGVYLYVVKDGVKLYIDVYQSESGGKTYTNVGFKESPVAVFVYNEEYDTYLTTVGEKQYFLGTRNDKEYNTFSACESKYLSTNFIGHLEEIVIPYKLFMYQSNLGKNLYFAGAMDGFYLASTETYADAVDVYLEEVEGGVVFYFMNNGEKAYIDIYQSESNGKTYTNIGFDTGNAAVFTFDEEADTYLTKVGEKYYFIGTRGDKEFDTFSACESKYIGENFVAIFVTEEPSSSKEVTAANAIAKLDSLMADLSMFNVTGDYTLETSVVVEGVTYSVTWKVSPEDILYAAIVNNKTLHVEAPIDENKEFSLIATVTNTTNANDVETKTYGPYAVLKEEIDDSNEVAPTKGIFSMYQGNLNKTLYLTGEMDEFYFATTENIEEAVEVGTETTEGGVYLYVVKNGAKSYIDVYQSESNGRTYTNVGFKESPAAVFVYNEEYDTYLTTVGEKQYFLGTRNDKEYNTFSACESKYLSTNFIGHFEEIEIPYKLFMYQDNLGKNLYFAGVMDEFYLGTTETYAEAVDVYLEEVEGGVVFYFMNNGEKAYIDIYQSESNGKTYTNIGFETGNAAVFTFDEEANTYLTKVGEKYYFIGTRGDKEFDTFSACESKYIDSNFVAVFVTEEQEAEEETPTKGGYFVKVTEEPTDWSGTYLIVYDAKSKAFNGSLAKSSINSGNALDVTIVDSKIEATETLKNSAFVFASMGNNEYSIQSASQHYYICLSGAKAVQGVDTAQANTITFDGSDDVKIGNNGALLQFNESATLFRYYTSKSQKNVSLYKLVEE